MAMTYEDALAQVTAATSALKEVKSEQIQAKARMVQASTKAGAVAKPDPSQMLFSGSAHQVADLTLQKQAGSLVSLGIEKRLEEAKKQLIIACVRAHLLFIATNGIGSTLDFDKIGKQNAAIIGTGVSDIDREYIGLIRGGLMKEKEDSSTVAVNDIADLAYAIDPTFKTFEIPGNPACLEYLQRKHELLLDSRRQPLHPFLSYEESPGVPKVIAPTPGRALEDILADSIAQQKANLKAKVGPVA